MVESSDVERDALMRLTEEHKRMFALMQCHHHKEAVQRLLEASEDDLSDLINSHYDGLQNSQAESR